MTHRAKVAQSKRVNAEHTYSEGSRRSQVAASGADEGLPSWGVDYPLSERNSSMPTQNGEDEEPEPSVIIDGEHWTETIDVAAFNDVLEIDIDPRDSDVEIMPPARALPP